MQITYDNILARYARGVDWWWADQVSENDILCGNVTFDGVMMIKIVQQFEYFITTAPTVLKNLF